MNSITSIIILSYNTLLLTQMCIESIRGFTASGTYEIIVVDNASKDGSVEWLKKQTDIRCIFNSENAGFPKGCNQGMEIATGEDILLLNSDTIVTPRWLEQLKSALYSSSDVGAVSCITNKCSNFQQCYVPYEDPLEAISFAEEYNHSNPSNWRDMFRLVAFCMLFKREIYDKIGGLDERFSPGNYEDDDYSLRIRLSGYRLLLCEDTFIHHFGSGSFVKRKNEAELRMHAEKYMALLDRNCKKFCKKWNVTSEYFSVNEFTHQIKCLNNGERILYIGGNSMIDLMFLHRFNEKLILNLVTNNRHDRITPRPYIYQSNVANIVRDIDSCISGIYDYIIIDTSICKRNDVLMLFNKLKTHVISLDRIISQYIKIDF